MNDLEQTRRKVVGQKIKRARLAAGYSSQKAFAAACRVDESSIGHAESGGGRIAADGKVYAMVEITLKWPDGCIKRYLASGDEAELPPTERRERPLADLTRPEAVRRAIDIARVDGRDAGRRFMREWADAVIEAETERDSDHV